MLTNACLNVRPKWMHCWILLSLMGLTLSVSRPAHGQDDFGDFGGGENVDKPARAVDDPTKAKLPPTSHPLVLDLRENPPTTPPELARALLYLFRLSQWEDIHGLLRDQVGQPVNEAMAMSMVQEIGVDQWLKISLRLEDLTDAEAKWVRQVLDKSSTLSRRPQVLDKHIASLRHPDIAEQKRGIRGIQSAGNEGLQYLLNHLMSKPATPSEAVMACVKSFGKVGEQAVRVAWTTNQPAQREMLAHLAARMEMKPNGLLLSAVYVSEESQGCRTVATQRLSQQGRLPSAQEVSTFLHQRLVGSLLELQRAKEVDVPLSRIVFATDSKGRLTHSNGTEVELVLQELRFWAASLLRQPELSLAQAADAKSALLETDYRNRMAWGVESMSRGDSEMGDDEAVVWASAVKYRLPGAQLDLVKGLGGQIARGAGEVSSSHLTILNEALKSAYPAVRYAAAEGMVPWLLTHREGWSPRAVETLVEMLGLEHRPTALVIGSNVGLRDHFTQLLSECGVSWGVVKSGREALQWIQRPNPVDFVMLTDRVPDVSLSQLIQRLKSHPRASMIPTVVMIDGITESEAGVLREYPSVGTTYVPPEMAGAVLILRNAESRSDAPLMTEADRVQWKGTAEQFFRDTAMRPQDQRHASLERFEALIATRLPGNRLDQTSDSDLSKMDEHDGQLELVQRIARQGAPLPTRQAASDALIGSLERVGLKLTTEEVQALYDSYNVEGRSDTQVRSLLGTLLDAIDRALVP